MKLTNAEIQAEADRLLAKSVDQFHRRHLLAAWLQSVNSVAVDQRCPNCAAIIVVETHDGWWTVFCPSGCDKTEFRGI